MRNTVASSSTDNAEAEDVPIRKVFMQGVPAVGAVFHVGYQCKSLAQDFPGFLCLLSNTSVSKKWSEMGNRDRFSAVCTANYDHMSDVRAEPVEQAIPMMLL